MSQSLKTAKTGSDTPKQKDWIDRVLRRGKQRPSPKPPEKGIDTAEFNMAQNFGILLAEAPFRDFPPTLRTKLRAPVETALDNHDLVAAAREMGSFKSAVAQFGPPFLLWQAAAPRLAKSEQQVVDLVDWKDPAAGGFEGRLAAIRQDADRGEFATALQALEIVETPIADAHEAAAAKAEWATLEAGPAYKRVQTQIATLKGWGNAPTADTVKMQAALLRLRKLALIDGNPALAVIQFEGVQADIAQGFNAWKAVREHNNLMVQLDKQMACVAHIPAKGTAGAPADGLWDAYTEAKAKVAGHPVTVVAGSGKLFGLRAAYQDAGKALTDAFESTPGAGTGEADATYWKDKAQSYRSANRILFERAEAVAPKTQAIEAQRTTMLTLKSKPAATWSDRYTDLVGAVAAAKQVIAARSVPVDTEEAKFHQQYRKVQPTLLAAAKLTDNTNPALQPFLDVYTPFAAKLAGTDDDRFAWCGARLFGSVLPKANAALQAGTVALQGSLKTVLEETDDATKAEGARALIANADPDILSRLSAKEHVDLLLALRADGMPEFDDEADKITQTAQKNDPKRVAMRKLYMNMSMEPGFVEQDNKTRKKMIDALSKDKEALKFARENWKTLTDAQKKEIMTKAAKAQCEAFGFPEASNGVEFSDFNVTYPNDKDDDGCYAPGADVIRLNTAQPVANDFEAALDLIFHENSHKYQNYLVGRLEDGSLTEDEDPPYTQATMFLMGNLDEGYIAPGEDGKAYNKQPEEDHAWTAGPASARMVMEMLAQ